MPKKRENKKIPEHWKRIPAALKRESPEAQKQAALTGLSPMEVEMKSELMRIGKINEFKTKLLDDFRNNYKKTKNPLFAWDAYLFARKNKEDIPPWIFQYFDNVALKLLDLETNRENPLELSQCLLFPKKSGGPGNFKMYLIFWIKRDAQKYMLNAANESNRGIDDICRDAQKYLKEEWHLKEKDMRDLKRNFNTELDLGTIKNWYYDIE